MVRIQLAHEAAPPPSPAVLPSPKLPFSAVAPPLVVSISRRRVPITLDTIFEEDSMELTENQRSCTPSCSSFSSSSSSSSCFFHAQRQKAFASYGHDCKCA